MTDIEDAVTVVADETFDRDEDLVRCLKAIWLGDYTVVPQGKDRVSEAVRKVAKRLSLHAQGEMNRVVNLSVQANETAILSAHMLSNLRNVDSEAQSIAAAAEQMVASVESIGDYGTTIAKQATDAGTSVNQGIDASKDAVGCVREISERVAKTVEKVDLLAGFSKQIGAISADIKEIALNTNILALNATVEAARAGDAGKGFAVVAAAVKGLSDKTRTSAEEIGRIAARLQVEMLEILNSMQENTKAVQEGESAILRVEHQMDEIQQRILEVIGNTKDIAMTLGEQAQASNTVAHGIANIAENCSMSVEGIEKIVTAMDLVEKLISGQIAKLAELNVPGKIIKLAQSDHVLWKKRLANMVIGREGLKAEELSDHHTCRLGKWYDAVEDPVYRDNPIFRSLIEPHQKVHAHGIQAVRYFNQGQMAKALEEIAEVELASKDVLSMLAELDEQTSA